MLMSGHMDAKARLGRILVARSVLPTRVRLCWYSNFQTTGSRVNSAVLNEPDALATALNSVADASGSCVLECLLLYERGRRRYFSRSALAALEVSASGLGAGL